MMYADYNLVNGFSTCHSEILSGERVIVENQCEYSLEPLSEGNDISPISDWFILCLSKTDIFKHISCKSFLHIWKGKVSFHSGLIVFLFMEVLRVPRFILGDAKN